MTLVLVSKSTNPSDRNPASQIGGLGKAINAEIQYSSQSDDRFGGYSKALDVLDAAAQDYNSTAAVAERLGAFRNCLQSLSEGAQLQHLFNLVSPKLDQLESIVACPGVQQDRQAQNAALFRVAELVGIGTEVQNRSLEAGSSKLFGRLLGEYAGHLAQAAIPNFVDHRHRQSNPFEAAKAIALTISS